MPQPVPDNLAFDDVVIDFAGRRLSRGGARTGAGTQGLRRACAAGRFARPGVHPRRNPGRGLGPPARHPERAEPDHEPAAPGAGRGRAASAPAAHGARDRLSLRPAHLRPTEPDPKRGYLPSAIALFVVAGVARCLRCALLATAVWLRKERSPDNARQCFRGLAAVAGGAGVRRPVPKPTTRNTWPTAWPRKSSTSWRRCPHCGWWDAPRVSRSRARTKSCAPSAGSWVSPPAGRQRAQGWRPTACHRPADPRRRRKPPLVEDLRARTARRVRGAG